MNVFQLKDRVLDRYGEYVQSFLNIADPEIRAVVTEQLSEQRTLWPEALLQLNPAYRKRASISDIVHEGLLHPKCSDIFRHRDQPIRLYQHQEEAIRIGLAGNSFVVTTGTGSGKSLTHFVPIFDAVLRHNPRQARVHAIVVYPMNALVNSQHESLQRRAAEYQQLTGEELPVRFEVHRPTNERRETRMSAYAPSHTLDQLRHAGVDARASRGEQVC